MVINRVRVLRSGPYTPTEFFWEYIRFVATHLRTWVGRSTVRVSCPRTQNNGGLRSGLEHGPPDPETNALTMRPPHV